MFEIIVILVAIMSYIIGREQGEAAGINYHNKHHCEADDEL